MTGVRDGSPEGSLSPQPSQAKPAGKPAGDALLAVTGLTKHFQERGYLQGDPAVYVGLTSATEILRNCEFGPLMQELTAPLPKSSR